MSTVQLNLAITEEEQSVHSDETAVDPFIAIVTRAASQIGAKIVIEPEFRFGGQIFFKNGKTAFFRYKFFDINPLASVELGRDKHAARFFMKKFGFSVPEEFAFVKDRPNLAPGSRPSVRDALKFANGIGYPVIVKPNSLTKGTLVTKVYDDAELMDAAQRVFTRDDIALVQRFYPLNDYRLVALDDHLVNAYRRVALTVTGDGVSTIGQLIEHRQAEILEGKQEVTVDVDDYRLIANIRRMGLSLTSIVENGRRLQLLDNANVSNGGDAFDISDQVHDGFAKVAIDVTRKMGLRLCGVDLLTEDISAYSPNHIVLEINGAPGWGNVGEVPGHVVEGMYRDVLKAIEQQ
jgi:D-alanine-D-alanine ligase-like ATP-grasp enzyme